MPCNHTPTRRVWRDHTTLLDQLLGLAAGWWPDYTDWFQARRCEHGRCVLDACPACGHIVGGLGSPDCPCATYPPDPRQRPRPRPFGLKPSLARRRAGRHRARPRT